MIMRKLLPGMMDSGTEFFTDSNGEIKVITNGSVISFDNLTPYLYHKVNEVMLADKPALAILQKWYPNSDTEQLKKYVSCRFGGLDYSADFDNGLMQCGEYVDCPLRGSCEGEGIVCKQALYKDQELSLEEIQLLKFISTPYTNENISSILGIPLGSFHKIKKTLYKKLNIQTKQEANTIAIKLGIVSV